MVAATTVLYPTDLLNQQGLLCTTKRQSSFRSTHSRGSLVKEDEGRVLESTATSTSLDIKKRVRFLCTDELDWSENNSDNSSSFSQDTFVGAIHEQVVLFEKVAPSTHGDIWWTATEIAGFRSEIRRTAQHFGADYPVYGDLLEYVLLNGTSIESAEIDVERMRARRRRKKSQFAVSMQWLSISDELEEERYDDEGSDEEDDNFASCDDEVEDCDFFPCMRGLENRVIPAFRQRRRWAINQVLCLQDELKNRTYEQLSTGLRILSQQVAKKATCYAQHQAFLDAREAADLHGL